MKWLQYGWRVFWEVMYFLVFVAVMNVGQSKFETVLIAVLGMIYCTVRTTWIGMALMMAHLSESADRQFGEIRVRLQMEPKYVPPEEIAFVAVTKAKLWIVSFFIGAAWMASALTLWLGLSR